MMPSLVLRWKALRPELRTRVITALIGGSVFLVLTLGLGYWGTVLCSIALSLAMMMEYLSMILFQSDHKEKKQVFLGSVWLVGFFSGVIPQSDYPLLLASFVGLFIYFLVTASRHATSPQGLESHFRELVFGFFGLVYLGFLPRFLPLIRDQNHGGHWFFVFLLMNWVGDSAAYFVGLKKGRRKLYPLISPNKTWEGALGGLVGSFLVVLLYRLLVFREMSWAFVFLGPLLVGITSQLGDLCESFLKRVFGRKDSGQLLPGHGGVLDRFDGIVISAPVMYFCCRIFG